jgi:hypothetical protein
MLHMFPVLSANDSANMLIRNPEFFRGSCKSHILREVNLANFNHFQFGQFCRSIFFSTIYGFWMRVCSISFSESVSSFFISVGHIFGIGAEKKMVRINARRIIAFVKNPKAVWNCPIVNCPRNPVSHRLFKLEEKLTVTLPRFSSYPHPTRPKFGTMLRDGAVFINLAPKPIDVFSYHNKKTPTNSEVKSAQCERQRNWQVLNFGFIAFYSHFKAGKRLTENAALST